MSRSPDARAVTAPPAPATVPRACANCGAPLEGPYCSECGQAAKTPLRHFGALLEDAADLFFNFDGRLLQTLPALLLRPGFLSREYFAGRRVRYLSPFRLMFVLAVVAFLALHLAIGDTSGAKVAVSSPFADAATPAAVQAQLQESLAQIASARSTTPPGAAQIALDVAARQLQAGARQRLLELDDPAAADALKAPASAATAATPPAAATGAPDAPEIHAAWLSASMQQRLTRQLRAIESRFQQAAHDPGVRRDLVASFFRLLPQSMLVLVPLFALLMKLAWPLRRRLYIEHLVVAMHSHAFLFLTLLLLSLASLAGTAWPMLATPTGMLRAALFCWVPVYLLLATRHVYGQGWFLSVLKVGVLGVAYLVLLSVVLAGTAVVGALVA